MLRIKLIRSTVAHNPRNRRTVEALGLRKIRQVVTLPDNPSVRGMIHNVKELLHVEEVPNAVATDEAAPAVPKVGRSKKKATTEEA